MEKIINRIDKLFKSKSGDILSVYFTAGFPQRDSTTGLIQSLQDAGADMIEIGIPFSDPLADGPIIQRSNNSALNNGMKLNLLFEQIKDIRKSVTIPLLIMTYLNPVYKFGIEDFCLRSNDVGIDGLIIPDLTPEYWLEKHRTIFEENGLHNILLITPQTSEMRIRMIDNICNGFIYMVSTSAVTGIRNSFSDEQIEYFKRIAAMDLSNPLLIGFGIFSYKTFLEACKYSNGAVIGSAFIKMLAEKGNEPQIVYEFINNIKGTS